MSSFVYYNNNPKKIRTGDCVYRAIAFAFGISWRDAVDMLVSWTADRGLVSTWKSGFNPFLEENGWRRHRTPRKGMTVGEFATDIADKNKTYIIVVARHLSIIWATSIVDTWDCSNKILEAYWVKE